MQRQNPLISGFSMMCLLFVLVSIGPFSWEFEIADVDCGVFVSNLCDFKKIL